MHLPCTGLNPSSWPRTAESQFEKVGAAMLAVPLVIAPVLRSKLSANDTTPERAEGMLMVVPRENGNVTSTVSAPTSGLYTLVPFPPIAYFAPVDDPVPDTWERSKVRITAGGLLNLLLSSTSSLETCACPE